MQPIGSFGGAEGGVGTLGVGGSRRSGKYLGGGSQASGRSASDNRSNIGVNAGGMGNSGGTTMAGMISGVGQPNYSHHMGSKETNNLNDLAFMGLNP